MESAAGCFDAVSATLVGVFCSPARVLEFSVAVSAGVLPLAVLGSAGLSEVLFFPVSAPPVFCSCSGFFVYCALFSFLKSSITRTELMVITLVPLFSSGESKAGMRKQRQKTEASNLFIWRYSSSMYNQRNADAGTSGRLRLFLLLPVEHLFDIKPGVGSFYLRYFFRGTFCDNGAAAGTAFRA